MTSDEQTKIIISYGDLIDLYESASDDDHFIKKFHEAFPSYNLSRPKRLIETVHRIVAPTKPSLRGPSKLNGSSLLAYRRRMWKPHVPNPIGSSSDIQFPVKLHLNYGLDEALLVKCFDTVKSGKKSPWILERTTPKASFYEILHPFLKRWSKTCQSTKSLIGSFYVAIDSDFAGIRPDNVYRYVESLCKKGTVSSLCCSTEQNSSQENDIGDSVSSLSAEVLDLRQKLELSKKKLALANSALKDITNEKIKVQKERDSAVKRATRYHKANTAAMNDIENLIEEFDASESFSADRNDSMFSPDVVTANNIGSQDFTSTKSGKTYSNSVRKLYYTLLSSGIPVKKVETLVKDVVKWSNPSVDVSKLELPKRSCAGYIRKEELKVISNAHKASLLCEQIDTGMGLRINTDGTTKNQKKINGIAINGMTISVNEISDGSSLTAINDLARELETLRKTARVLGLPNADAINWSIIESSSSDSAATQKHFNDLLLEKKESDSEKFDGTNPGGADFNFVENFCSIHLGVNLRKAFLCGASNLQAGDNAESRHAVDVFVHQFCKVFGKHGSPEYECGVQQFPDFLKLMCEDKLCPQSRVIYYQHCLELKLQRQIGNRYFVTACNASNIIFLMTAAIEFMEYTGKRNGNKLEKEVYLKLKDEQEILQIILDSLMYFHVYADLVMISKSKELNKSSLDMNTHYLELRCFLTEAEKHPEIVLERETQVFISERRLYGKEKATNHRLNKPAVYQAVFDTAAKYGTFLKPLIVSGCNSMHDKLSTYAANQLPGGIYWEPEDPAIRKILSELSPSNDLCESLLGLNDYLTTSLPNLHQMSRSNLVEVKKNKTIHWLEDLETEHQDKIINLAVMSKQQVRDEFELEKKARDEERRQKMKCSHQKQVVSEKRAIEEKRKLSELHFIATTAELEELLQEVDEKDISQSKKDLEKLQIIKTQINIRKKVLQQKIEICFTQSKRKRPITDIITEFQDHIIAFPLPDFVYNPPLFVGKVIHHKFQLSDEETKWYQGTVLSYDKTSKMHEIIYDEEEEPCFFDIILDFMNGDLKVVG